MSRPLRVVSLFDASGNWASGAPEGSEIYTVDLSGQPGLRVVRGRKMFHMPCDVAHAGYPFERADVVLAAPPCEALGGLHAQQVQRGRASMTREQGLALVATGLDIIRRLAPKVWCMENPVRSALWTLTPLIQKVKWGWFGYPATKWTGFGGVFELVALPDPLPIIDPTEGGRRPCALKPGVGGVQAMSRKHRATTPAAFADAWWKAQLESGRLQA